MTLVGLPETVRNAIQAHGRSVSPEVACGLLLGTRSDDGPAIVRALRCVNEAPAEDRGSAFAIDPRALVNVRRSLAGRQLAIVGVYHVAETGAIVPAEEDLRQWRESIWLAASPEEFGEPYRVWWSDAEGGGREVALELVDEAAHRKISCPE